MPEWPGNPIIYEINTWVWLGELGRRYGRQVTLGSVPREEWDALGALNVDAVWLMGVWKRSPLGARIAAENAAMADEFRRVLPDFSEADNVGSPYCVRRYEADENLGGRAGLSAARTALAERGLLLVLDYVPNHVALDHPAIREHAEHFIRGDAEDLQRDPEAFFEVEGNVIARGRDPNFPPWPDVAQLNAFSPAMRAGVKDMVAGIAAQCDGMRCDMAMLMMTDVFRRTWGDRAGPSPASEFWPELIGSVRERYPNVAFIAEAYWDLEFALMEQGFDYCYDKRLYDRLVHEDAETVRGHLHADHDYQQRLVRFIENHDEPRAADTLQPSERARAAATICMTLPGARLLHMGQSEGKRTRIPVFLRRGPEEPVETDLQQFYARLLGAVRAVGGLREQWSLLSVLGWPDNQTCRNLLAWSWTDGESRTLVIVNYSSAPAQGVVEVSWPDLAAATWRLTDPLSDQLFEREGGDMQEHGLFVQLDPWGMHFFHVSAGNSAGDAPRRRARAQASGRPSTGRG